VPSKLIEILCDGGSAGFGHLSRCSSLGRALRERGHRVRVCAVSEQGRSLLPPSPQDPGPASLLVLDLPQNVDETLGEAESLGIPAVALDYAGPKRPALTISVLERARPPFQAKRLSGLDYAIVREDVRRLRPAPQGSGVLVVIGGGDVRNDGIEAVRGLAYCRESVTWVQGPCRRDEAASNPPEGVRVLSSPENLPQLMAQCRWAVANGGTTMMELLCLGKPVHVLSQTSAEEEFARPLLERGALLGMGPGPLREPSLELASRVSAQASRVIDGCGIDRICSALESLL